MPSSVEALVAEKRVKACEEVHAEVMSRGLGGVVTHGDIQVLTDAALDAAGVPALVEALGQIAGSVDYEPSAAEVRKVGREWFEGFNDARQRAAGIASAALGGEQVQGRAELEARVVELQGAVDRAHSAMRSSEYVGGPSERDAWRTAVSELGAVATQHQGMDPDAAGESSTTTEGSER